MDLRIKNEIEHGKKISHDAENIWGWGSPAGKRRANRRADYFVALGNFNNTDSLLEIGCGTGIFTEKMFAATKAKITAIDVSEELTAKAKVKVPQVTFELQDAMNTKYPDNSFDGVFGSSVLHHLEMGRAVNEIFRVLKPGGRVVFAEPNMLNPQIFIERNISFVKKYLGVSPDETAVIRWKMKNLLKQTGFEKCDVFPYDFLHPFTPVFIIGFVEFAGKICEKIPLVKEIAGSVVIYAQKPI